MKKLLILFCFLIIWLHSLADTTYCVTGWRYYDSVTLVKIEFDFGKWLVFMCDGYHVNDTGYVFAHGCVLTARSGKSAFPLTERKYISRKDEQRIKQSLGLESLCNRS